MTRFERGIVKESEGHVILLDLVIKWRANNPEIRKLFPAVTDEAEFIAKCRETLADVAIDEVWLNDTYQVAVRRREDGVFHLSIKRLDRQPCKDWRDFQQIKNEIIGPECEAVELYPAESRLVDTANQYHLWGMSNPAWRFPLGFDRRMVSNEAIGKSVNRRREP